MIHKYLLNQSVSVLYISIWSTH